MSAITAANLSDGRTQVWLIEANTLQSRWKEATDPDAAWTNWSPFPSPDAPAAISAAPLEDGRIQLYLVDGEGGVWTAWKTSTSPDASWTDWSKFS
jgi:hypothetical protein